MTEKLQLTQEEKRIKIAEACGWRHFYDDSPMGNHWIAPSDNGKGKGKSFNHVPDYFGSLDAMHEAEKVLRGPQVGAYHIVLEESVGAWPWHATAPQRAEAFGKSLNLWR